jgi:23S rRNA (adenine2503-C2)-methyltransferase
LTEASIDAVYLRELFDPKYFICKITPITIQEHVSRMDLSLKLDMTHINPYQKVEKELKEVGFDVIVFIPSHEEDSSKITCGNAILARG